jgi:protein-S-isoprenylcysteine O-methyltransferase Ste14
MGMIKVVVFILLSLALVAFTLLRRQRHRFPRLVVFESVLGLVVLNAEHWFRNPLSLRQLVSWVVLTLSLALAIHGFRLLHVAGSPQGDFEQTTRLVTTGAYHYIRHPMYCSLLLLGVGAFLKNPSFPSLLILLVLGGFVYVTGRIEEAENVARFGEEYLAYMNKTKMFIPFLI